MTVYESGAEYCLKDGAGLVPDPDDEMLGAALYSYEILNLVGEGVSAKVYRARHRFLEDIVAVKVLRARHNMNPVLRGRFLREARALRTIQHEAVVALRDFGQLDDGRAFMVMDWVDGQTLRDFVEANPRLAPVRILMILRQLAEALSAAHDAGLVHRDLKPSNIMIGEDDHLVILDFGLVGFDQEGPQPANRLTRPGLLLGTPWYMAPEQIESGHVSVACDLYALGAVLYQLLEGHVPFHELKLAELFLEKTKGPPPPPMDAEGLGPLAMRLLSVDPSLRPTAHETLQLLAEVDLQASTIIGVPDALGSIKTVDTMTDGDVNASATALEFDTVTPLPPAPIVTNTPDSEAELEDSRDGRDTVPPERPTSLPQERAASLPPGGARPRVETALNPEAAVSAANPGRATRVAIALLVISLALVAATAWVIRRDGPASPPPDPVPKAPVAVPR